MINVHINGKPQTLDKSESLSDVLKGLEVNPFAVVVEHNERVIKRNQLSEVSVQEGDKIEIIHFIGGGSDEPSSEGSEAPQPEDSVEKKTEAAAEEKKAEKKPKKKKKKTKPKKAVSRSSSKAKNLVIVESPAKAKTINKFLGSDYQVEASMGHVRDLPKSKMGVDVENNFKPDYIVVMKARKTVSNLKKQAKGKQDIYLAPDPDREGEAISWHLKHIFQEADGEYGIHRVVFNEITKDAILEAFKHPREIEQPLVDAQQARRILDRIVGYELSPLLWRKVGRGLSAGRVQSVALRLIVEREREIKKFVPQEYWSMEAKLSSEAKENVGRIFLSKLEKIDKEKIDIKNKEEAKKIRDEILKLPFKVESIKKHERRRKPHAPYTTSKLQQEAYNRLGFPAAKTMRLAQRLYEGTEIGDQGSVGLITYMRTDSVNIAKSAQDEAIKFIKEKHGDDYLPKTPPVFKSKKRAQEAHEAIRPTSAYREPKSIRKYLEDDEYRLYDLIWRKFIACQMTAAIDEQIAVSILAGEKYHFKTTGRRNLFPGFMVLYQEPLKAKSEKEQEEGKKESDGPQELPDLKEGEILTLHELMGYQHFTKPPARYNDASLVKLLELKGIGRPSTYAPTIYTLIVREYVNRQGGALIPTELGEIVVDLLVQHFPRILDVEFTAGMEDELDKIEEEGLDWVKVLKDFYMPFETLLQTARVEMKNVKREEVPTEHTCELCGKNMVIKWGRFGKFLACPGFPDCKNTRSIPTGHRCPEPNCGGDLVKRKSKKRRTFYGCSNYPKCNHISNKLPRQEETISEDDKISEVERETLGP